MKPTTLSCLACQGSGRVPIPEGLQDILDALRAGSKTAAEIHEELVDNIGVTAVNNRLTRLYAERLVVRIRSGHGYRWKLRDAR